LNLLNTSPWNDEDVRAYAADDALRALTKDEPIEAWSLDDTGFLQQGDDSVGVQRQDTGSAGKIANGQVGVRLTVATRTAHLPIDRDLYVPESWASDPERRKAAKIPDDVVFRTKHDLALELLAQAVLADAAARLRARRQRLRFVRALPWRGHPARPAVRLRRAFLGRRASRRRVRSPPRPRLGQGAGRELARQGVARGDVARGDQGAASLALRASRSPESRSRTPTRTSRRANAC
jgi:DDE superfamily endonuclease